MGLPPSRDGDKDPGPQQFRLDPIQSGNPSGTEEKLEGGLPPDKKGQTGGGEGVDAKPVPLSLTGGAAPMYSHDETLLQQLLKDGLDVSHVIHGAHADAIELTHFTGNTPLHLACLKGHKEVAVDLIRSKPLSLATCNDRRATPLHFAALARQVDLIPLFGDTGSHAVPDPNALTAFENTALHCAVIGQSLETVQALLALGADPTCRNRSGNTPLHLAALLGDAKVVRAILEAKTPPEQEPGGILSIPLVAVAPPDGMEQQRRANEANGGGETPVHMAAKAGSCGSLQALFSAHAHVEMVSLGGETALSLGKRFGHESFIEAVLSLDYGGKRALAFAVEQVSIAPRALVDTFIRLRRHVSLLSNH